MLRSASFVDYQVVTLEQSKTEVYEHIQNAKEKYLFSQGLKLSDPDTGKCIGKYWMVFLTNVKYLESLPYS